MRSAAITLLLLSIGVSQTKPTAPLDGLIACVKAKACKNAVPSTISWADYGAEVMTVADGAVSYSLGVPRYEDSLTIWPTPKGERRPDRIISVGAHGRVLEAELGPQPGEPKFPMRMTPEQAAERRKFRRAYRSSEADSNPGPGRSKIGTWGDEHRTYWQEQADQALAAIQRTISK